MKWIALVLGMLVAAAALAQDKPEQPRAPLNLRIDDASSAAPRISFGQTPATQSKDDREKGLPELGGKTKDQYTRPIDPARSGSPIPQPMEPTRNYDLR